ncbi:hypothetical protein PbDSM24746_21940 [Paenibacillus macerans]|nr:hypothetical protein PbDSM24746_21940 [Paenibacillus macerans]GBK68501.1 hypothetical protein PbJCM17693_22090 [Paenibacillus macerans]GIP10299.1 hypothetical protein J1TS5_24690 [Paenibacillus macerans]
MTVSPKACLITIGYAEFVSGEAGASVLDVSAEVGADVELDCWLEQPTSENISTIETSNVPNEAFRFAFIGIRHTLSYQELYF